MPSVRETQCNTCHKEKVEDQVSNFLCFCLKMLSDIDAANNLTHMLKICMGEEEIVVAISSLLPKRDVHQVRKHKRTRREFNMKVKHGSYEMDDVMLDMGSGMNIFPNKSWELMGKTKFVWSPIQLRLANQYQIYPIIQLDKVEANIGGVNTKTNIQVIDIMDDLDPYRTLLGIDWEFDNNAILNMTKWKISFEIDTLHVISPLYPNQGDIYDEPVNEDAQSYIIEKIYNITRHRGILYQPHR